MPREFAEYPKWKYREGEAPRLVNTHNEEVELGEGWFDKPDMTNHDFDLAKAAQSAAPPGYQPKEYPKWRYAKEIPGGKIVNSEEEEDALADSYPEIEWFDKPDFTDHGDESTDVNNPLLYTQAAPQPNALSGPTTLEPVPEMRQGKAAQKSSSIVEQKDDEDFGDEDEDAPEDDNEDNEAEDADEAGEPLNNFDNANGDNPDDVAGDAVPEGENPNGPTGKVTRPLEDNKAQEAKKPKAKKTTAKNPKKKDADDLL